MAVRQRKKGFSTFVSAVLENSMLTGIPKIVQAGNWPKRISRTLVFLVCVAGFIYQTLAFMKIYWKYETVVNVQVYNPLEDDRPAFTVCSYRGLKVQELCTDPNHELHQLEEYECYIPGSEPGEDDPFDWCKCVPRFCDYFGNLRNLSTIADDVGLDATLNFRLLMRPWEEVKRFFHGPRDMIRSCLELMVHPTIDKINCLRKPEESTIQVPFHSHWFSYQSCFTRDSILHRPNATIEKIRTIGVVEITLENLSDDFDDYYFSTPLWISIHSPYTATNPFTEGFVLAPAGSYYLYLKKVVKKLLPHPYQTDCIDYREMWKQRGGRGPTNLKECIQECYRNLSMERHGCILKYINTPQYDPRCNEKKYQDNTLFIDSQPCIDKNCRPACYEEYYAVTEDVTEIFEGNGCGGLPMT